LFASFFCLLILFFCLLILFYSFDSTEQNPRVPQSRLQIRSAQDDAEASASAPKLPPLPPLPPPRRTRSHKKNGSDVRTLRCTPRVADQPRPRAPLRSALRARRRRGVSPRSQRRRALRPRCRSYVSLFPPLRSRPSRLRQHAVKKKRRSFISFSKEKKEVALFTAYCLSPPSPSSPSSRRGLSPLAASPSSRLSFLAFRRHSAALPPTAPRWSRTRSEHSSAAGLRGC